jgi:hypothetical protein
MAVGLQQERVAWWEIAALALAAVIIAGASIYIFTRVSDNFFMASYFTAEALFDASPLGADLVIAAHAPLFSNAFYIVIGTAVVDGIAKSLIVGFVLAAFINFITSIDVRAKFGSIGKKNMKGHVIVCGYSMLAERLCRDLKDKNIRFVVIDKDPEKANTPRDLGYSTINGDFTDKKVLEEASIFTAKAVVFATESDFINLLGIVTARHTDPKAEIISRATEELVVTKMHRGGANFCLVPEQVAGIELGNRIAGD